MSEPTKVIILTPEELKSIVREAMRAERVPTELLEPEELARRLKVPLSWVYEQSRLGHIPSYKAGRYIRFDFAAVLESPACQKKIIENGQKTENNA